MLALLDVQGCLLTMDAIGCQKSVTQAIAIAGAGVDYLLALKSNQPALQQAVEAAFAATASAETTTTTGEKPTYGRVETRTCRVLPADYLPTVLRGPEWIGLHTLRVATTEIQYYLSSRRASAAVFQGYVRRHWGIENRLHWMLDVIFGEDHSRKRADHVAANCAIICKFVLNLLRAQPKPRA